MTKLIPASEWRKMDNREILGSVEIAIRVLKDRVLDPNDKRHAGELAKDLIDLAIGREEAR